MGTTPARARVAGAVRAELARQGLRQVDVAASMGISVETLSRRLRGRVAFDVDELDEIAGLLEVDGGSLYTGAMA